MIKGLKMVCGEIHFPTLFICGGCLFSTFYPCTELAGMIRVKCAVAGMFILLLSCIKAIISKKPLVAHPEKILKTFLLLCVVEILVAILQSTRVLLSYNSYFRFTGSFDNPAILAMMMAVCLPISLFCTIRAIGEKQKIWFLLTLCMVACLMLAESRACIIAGVCSSFIISYSAYPQFRTRLLDRKVIIPVIAISITLLIALYYYKQDSADGRTLMWIVSLKMIGEKPLLGWGPDGFSASYMPHQAAYLLQHPDTKWAYLADNASHPFNEILLFGVKYGIVGIAILLLLITLLVRMTIKIRDGHKSLYLSILITLFVLSMFSYPYEIPMIWLVSTFLVCSVVCSYCADFSKMRIPTTSILIFWISWIAVHNRHICDEWRWKKLQISSASTEAIRQGYSQLYPNLKDNPSFIYNYGAWLHHNGYYRESLEVLDECTNSLNDYNVEILLADDYRQLGDIKESIKRFEVANTMIPSRFLPLYHEMMTYEDIGDYVNACCIARKIINKPVKIQRAASVKRIIHEAEEMLSLHDKGNI